MAQTGMAKGPDGTGGFLTGWTKRISPYHEEKTLEDEDEAAADVPDVDGGMNAEAAAFCPKGISGGSEEVEGKPVL